MAWLFDSAPFFSKRGSVTILLLGLVIWFGVIGCSGTVNPIMPAGTEVPQVSLQNDESNSARTLWGYWLMRVNEDHTRIEVEPVRSVAFHMNALWVIQAFAPDAITVGDMQVWPDGSVTVIVTLTHPYAEYVQYTAFDVRGIVMFPTVYEFPEMGLSTPGVFPGQSALLNADGYTRRWNPTEFSDGPKNFNYFDGKLIPQGLGAGATSLVNPFKRYESSQDRNYYQCGDTLERHYRLSFPSGPMVFGYAVDASWEPNLIEDLYATDFGPFDAKKDLWEAYDEDFGTTSLWACDWFEGSVNVREEACDYYGDPYTSGILLSPKIPMPADPSKVSMYLMHQIWLDAANEYDLCSIAVTPDSTLASAVQVSSEDHPYEFLDDPELGLDWWNSNYQPLEEDKFDLSEALSGFTGDYFWIAFIFYTLDGDDGSNDGGWTLEQLRIEDLNMLPDELPGDFPSIANSWEPWNVQMTEVAGSLECSIGIYSGGTVNMKVEVNDWQDDAFQHFTSVSVEAPALFAGVKNPWTGSGDASTYTYEIIVPNEKAVEPGTYPVLFSVNAPEDDPYYIPDDPLASYMLFTLDVNEIAPPFCLDETAIHAFGGGYQLNNANPANHYDACFLPVMSGGAGGLLFEGGMSGGNEYIMAGAVPGVGGNVDAFGLIQRIGGDAGTAFVLQPNEYNGHLLVVTDNDPDNLLVYDTTGTLLKPDDVYDLGSGDDGKNEPVCLTTNPQDGAVWFVGNRGSAGIYLERWAFIEQGGNFEYAEDPTAKLDLSEWLGPDPKPLGIEISAHSQRLYLFHARGFGTIDVWDVSQIPPVYVEDYSVTNLFGQALAPSSVPGLRKYIGGDIVFDHADGESETECRLLVFANTADGGSWLKRLDVWNQTLATTSLGSPFSCMAINNLAGGSNRGLVFFSVTGGTDYLYFPAPSGW